MRLRTLAEDRVNLAATLGHLASQLALPNGPWQNFFSRTNDEALDDMLNGIANRQVLGELADEKAEVGIWLAKRVLPIFEEAFPEDDRPRKAIEAIEEWVRQRLVYGSCAMGERLEYGLAARHSGGRGWTDNQQPPSSAAALTAASAALLHSSSVEDQWSGQRDLSLGGVLHHATRAINPDLRFNVFGRSHPEAIRLLVEYLLEGCIPGGPVMREDPRRQAKERRKRCSICRRAGHNKRTCIERKK